VKDDATPGRSSADPSYPSSTDSSPVLILASASPRRRELLTLTGLPFRALPASVEESAAGGPAAHAAARLAQAKARAVAALHPRAIVLGCDTVVAVDGTALGKPSDEDEARAILARLRGRTHFVYSAIALAREGHELAQIAETVVTMRDYTDAELECYVSSGDPLDKAGAYGIQHPTFRPAASWVGCYANVLGLPLCHLTRALRTWSVVPPAAVPATCQNYTGQRCTVYPHILSLP
jgi:septum formation protein